MDAKIGAEENEKTDEKEERDEKEDGYEMVLGEDGKTGFRCSDCGKSFSHRGMMRRHLKVHAPKSEFVCTICNKRFSYRSTLERHREKIHTNKQPPHRCRVCTRRFRYKTSLELHMMVHRDERPHECPTCGKLFRTKFKLAAHIRVHDGPNTNLQFRCVRGCGRIFHSFEAWKIHTHQTCSQHIDIDFFLQPAADPNLISEIPTGKTHSKLVGPNLITTTTI